MQIIWYGLLTHGTANLIGCIGFIGWVYEDVKSMKEGIYMVLKK